MIRKNRKIKQDKKLHELDDCTFKPRINTYKTTSKSQSPMKKPQVGSEKLESSTKKHLKVSTAKPTLDRCKYLYNISKKIKREEKNSDSEEEEKEQYSFSPNINKNKIKSNPLAVSQSTVDKEIQRMRKANEDRKRMSNGFLKDNGESGMKFSLGNDRGKTQLYNNKRKSYSYQNLNNTKEKYSKINEYIKNSVNDLNNNIEVDLYKSNTIKPMPCNRSTSPVKQSKDILKIILNLNSMKKEIMIKNGDNIDEIIENITNENRSLFINIDLTPKQKIKLSTIINAKVKETFK